MHANWLGAMILALAVVSCGTRSVPPENKAGTQETGRPSAQGDGGAGGVPAPSAAAAEGG